MNLKELKVGLASPKNQKRKATLEKFRDGTFGLEALPVLRELLAEDDVSLVLCAVECIAKLGPDALTCPAGESSMPTGHGKERANLEWQLCVLGGRVWSYSLYSNCYSACLDALLKLEADEEGILEYIHNHIGLSDEDLIPSLNALKAIGTRESRDLLKRSVAFWLPELDKSHVKEVKALVATVK